MPDVRYTLDVEHDVQNPSKDFFLEASPVAAWSRSAALIDRPRFLCGRDRGKTLKFKASSWGVGQAVSCNFVDGRCKYFWCHLLANSKSRVRLVANYLQDLPELARQCASVEYNHSFLCCFDVGR